MPAKKIETYIRASDGKVRYRARPWDAERSRALPSRSFDTESEAYAYVRQAEGRVDADYADVGIAVKRRRSRPAWGVFCTHWAATYNDGDRHRVIGVRVRVPRVPPVVSFESNAPQVP